MPSTTNVVVLSTTDRVPSLTVATIEDVVKNQTDSDREFTTPKKMTQGVETSDTESSDLDYHRSSRNSASYTSVEDNERLSGAVVVGTCNPSGSSSFFLRMLSEEPFQDPIVAPDGETYERAAFLKEHEHEDITDIELDPNRALKVILEDSRLEQSDSLHASLRRWHFKTKKAISGYLQDLTPSSSEDTIQAIEDNATDSFPLSDGFYCPITCNIMYDPVIDPDGNTFECIVIENWIRLHGTSATTRRNLKIEELRPNRILQRILEDEKQLPIDLMRPEIRKWIEEAGGPPNSSDVEYGGGMIQIRAAATAEQASSSSSAGTAAAGGGELAQVYYQQRRRMDIYEAIFTLVALIVFAIVLKYIRKLLLLNETGGTQYRACPPPWAFLAGFLLRDGYFFHSAPRPPWE